MKARSLMRSIPPGVVLAAALGSSILRGQGPVAYWPMNEGSGTVVSDASGRGHTGIVSGSAGQWSWTGGVAGQALTFNGGEQSPYMFVNNHADFQFGAGSFTLEAWVRSGGIVNDAYGEVSIVLQSIRMQRTHHFARAIVKRGEVVHPKQRHRSQ